MRGEVLLFLLIKESLAVIYSLNESDYNKMPPLYALDDYSSCLLEERGTYCVVDVDLYSKSNSDLMRMIQEYSAHKLKHFNHSQIHRGVCVTRTCKMFIQNRNLSKIADLEHILETCLNESLWKSYEIGGKLANLKYCKVEGEAVVLDTSDIIVAVVYLVLIALNTIGSFYDVLVCKEEKSGNSYLLAFSLKRNWARLVAPSGGGDEPRLERLKLFHGFRSMTMICVFFSHTSLIMAYSYLANPLYIEKAYEDPLKQILFNGSLVTHTFFVMSSFLLAYNFELYAEKHKVSWVQWPRGVLLRWIRLTPVYALVIASIATLMRHAGSGPLWELVVGSEASACRTYWWAHILYVNNYVYDDAFCTPQTWYLAADTQLFCLGLLVLVAARTPRARVFVLSAMFVTAMVVPALHTYFQNLDAVVIQSPESYRNLYAHDDTFRLLYIRGHTNLSTYTLGLIGGLFTYRWQLQEKDFSKYKKYRFLFWLTFPLGVAVILSGGLFYSDGDPPSTALRVIYATLYKPIFQILVVIIIIGFIFKFETVYRGIAEWRGWTWTGRVSYSSFFLHTIFQRGLCGIATAPTYISDYYVLMILASTIFLSFISAAVLFLCVEAPFAALVRASRTQKKT